MNRQQRRAAKSPAKGVTAGRLLVSGGRVLPQQQHAFGNGELLRLSLQAAVPMWVAEFRKRPLTEVQKQAPNIADTIGSKGDVILYRSKKKGETAKAFNELAKGIALLSFSPGGVKFMGDLYEYDHPEGWPWT